MKVTTLPVMAYTFGRLSVRALLVNPLILTAQWGRMPQQVGRSGRNTHCPKSAKAGESNAMIV
jgi:hypothetical protein